MGKKKKKNEACFQPVYKWSDQGSTLHGGWAGLWVGDPAEIVALSRAVALGGDAGVSGWVQSSSWLCCDPSGASWREQSQLLPTRAG